LVGTVQNNATGPVIAEYGFTGSPGKGSGLCKSKVFCLGFKASAKVVEHLEYLIAACGDKHGSLNLNTEKKGMLRGAGPLPEPGRPADMGRATRGKAPVGTGGAQGGQVVPDTDFGCRHKRGFGGPPGKAFVYE